MHRLCTLPALLLVAIFMSGCSLFKTEAKVTSDTSWSGSFDGRTVDGRGNQTISMGSSSGIKCATVQKQTREGSLTLRVESEEKTTTAAFGVVTACGGSL